MLKPNHRRQFIEGASRDVSERRKQKIIFVLFVSSFLIFTSVGMNRQQSGTNSAKFFTAMDLIVTTNYWFWSWRTEGENPLAGQAFPDIMIQSVNKQTLLLEHRCYVLVAKGKAYREVSADDLIGARIPSRIYARAKGRKKLLYAVDIKGKDGGGLPPKKILPKHANYFRSRGYKIPRNNLLECLSMAALNGSDFEIIFG